MPPQPPQWIADARCPRLPPPLHPSSAALSGPVDLEGCSQLTYLNLAFNLFTGPLPLAGVPRLRTLRVNNNRFSGPLPDALYELRQLQARARGDISLLPSSSHACFMSPS